MKELVKDIANAIKQKHTFPKMPEKIDLDTAYQIQGEVVAIVATDKLAGIKAGVTTAAAQQVFKLDDAVVGYLYADGQLSSGCKIKTRPGVAIECEVGIVIDHAGKPRSAGPVIELPCMAFADEEDRTGVNLVANNIAADRFIMGTQLDLLDSYDELSVRLERDGELVTTAPLSEALGGPYAALDWMLQEVEARKFQLEDGMLLITGACGGIQPAIPGQYTADYGPLGVIEFEII